MRRGQCLRRNRPAQKPRNARRLKITIESTFATVRNRSKITKGPGSKAAGIAMAFKLIEAVQDRWRAVQDRWRAVNGAHLVALVRTGATFKNGKLVERPAATPAAAARTAA